MHELCRRVYVQVTRRLWPYLQTLGPGLRVGGLSRGWRGRNCKLLLFLTGI